MARQVTYVGENQTEPYVYGFDVNLYGNDFTFIPKSVYEKGFIADGKQYYLPGVLNPEFEQAFQPYAKPFSVDNLQKADPKFSGDYSKSPFNDKEGYLVPSELSDTYLSKFGYYDVGENKDGFVFGEITGITTNTEGQKYFNVAASGRPNAVATATADGQVLGNWYDPGKKKRWYETPLGIAGIGLIGLGGLGLAGLGPLAGGATGASGAAAGGIVGTPGVSTIFPVAAPVAPTVTTLAPIATATAVPAAQLAFPGLEVAPTFTPAPGSLQAALPGLGVETAASAAPFTAIPGSFQAALPALGIASSPSLAGNLATSTSGVSVTDALRLANQAKGLLGAGENPLVPQQQGLPQGGGRSQGVDYSGLLSLLQLQARTPGVASLTAPAQLRQMYQPTLLPNVLSLLG